jgi:hypothetical protein
MDRMTETRTTKLILQYQPKGERDIGCPKKRGN